MALQEILIEQIQDLYDAEKQLLKALPRMARAAKHPELKGAFEEHTRVTEEQVRRIEAVFQELGQKPKSKPCAAMKGLVEEGREIISEDTKEGMLDAAIIGAAQKIEHYEISGYGTARAIAQAIGQKQAAQLLKQTEMEEGDTDKKLTKIAMMIYKEAGARNMEQERGAGSNGSGGGGSRRGGNSGGSGSRSARSSGGGGGSRKAAASSRGGRTSTRSASASASKRAGQGTSSRSASRSGGRSSGGGRSGGAQPITDHDQIRQWAEDRGATPSCVRGTGGKGDTGMIRLDFPGYSGAQSLQKIDWDEWFEKFDQNNLALLVQDKTAGGQKSNFNKLVSRETAAAHSGGRR
jgi:ferritin-like metal-binding protein YciE